VPPTRVIVSASLCFQPIEELLEQKLFAGRLGVAGGGAVAGGTIGRAIVGGGTVGGATVGTGTVVALSSFDSSIGSSSSSNSNLLLRGPRFEGKVGGARCLNGGNESRYDQGSDSDAVHEYVFSLENRVTADDDMNLLTFA
jgi:hypothetical protein